MIVYDLSCSAGHRFEGWFGSSDDFSAQQGRGLVTCPHCGTADVSKAPMAPAVPKKGNQRAVPPSVQPADSVQPVANAPMPPQVAEALAKIADMQREAIKQSEWVGDSFAEKSRAMHYGEADAKPIHGRASPEQTRELLEEGVAVSPLLFPFVPPDEVN